jgi:hypothetical protein
VKRGALVYGGLAVIGWSGLNSRLPTRPSEYRNRHDALDGPYTYEESGCGAVGLHPLAPRRTALKRRPSGLAHNWQYALPNFTANTPT